ncbi:hypothetical protein [Streptomyces sp. BBFR109]|uniref:hypothetical protein n=1 Tax=Streptomyces sp. BBFR109 TaxID=3448172 RepID=UPI003F7625AF
MSSKQRIKRPKFLEIKKAIRESEASGKFRTADVAEKTGVGRTTVSQVRAAKSWPHYQKTNAERQERRKSKPSMNPTGTSVEDAGKAARQIAEASISVEDVMRMKIDLATLKQGERVGNVEGRMEQAELHLHRLHRWIEAVDDRLSAHMRQANHDKVVGFVFGVATALVIAVSIWAAIWRG